MSHCGLSSFSWMLAVSGMIALAFVLEGQAEEAPRVRLVVDASGFRSDHGSLRCSLFASADAFPSHHDRALRRAQSKVTARKGRCVFDAIARGVYAVALYHDEDDDGALDTGIFGIPTEGVGVSRDARASFGPPSFEDARLELRAGENRIQVQIRYP